MSQEKLGTQTSIKREMAKIYSVGGILMWKFFKNFLSRVLRQMEQHRNMLTKESEGKRVTESPHFLKKRATEQEWIYPNVLSRDFPFS